MLNHTTFPTASPLNIPRVLINQNLTLPANDSTVFRPLTTNNSQPLSTTYCEAPTFQDVEKLAKKIELYMQKEGKSNHDFGNGLLYTKNGHHATLTYHGQPIYNQEQIIDPKTGKTNTYKTVTSDAIPQGSCLIKDAVQNLKHPPASSNSSNTRVSAAGAVTLLISTLTAALSYALSTL